jgi:hypothetical protein
MVLFSVSRHSALWHYRNLVYLLVLGCMIGYVIL